MDLIINPRKSFIQSVKDLIMKTETKEEEGEKRPSWVDELLEAMKPKKQEQEQEQEEAQEIPLPPAPVTEEVEEEEQEVQKKSPLKKAWEFLM